MNGRSSAPGLFLDNGNFSDIRNGRPVYGLQKEERSCKRLLFLVFLLLSTRRVSFRAQRPEVIPA